MIHIRIDPVLFQWRDVIVGWHGLGLAAGLFVAYQVIVREGRRKGIARHHLDELLCWIAVLGYIGARLLHVLDHWEVYATQPLKILALYEGGVRLYGALVGGMVATIVYARWRNLSFWHLADAVTMGIPASQIVGRVGCVINGDVWGLPTNGSWGLVYWHPDAAIPPRFLGVPTFPAPIVLQVWNVGLLTLLLVLGRRSHIPGSVFSTGLTGYSLGRLIVNVWQPGDPFLFRLKRTQVTSLALIVLGALLLLYVRIQAQSSSRTPTQSRQDGSVRAGHASASDNLEDGDRLT
jgi:phosphatidylglycerol:prolipoprotein diacylglycerol transferase